MEQVQKQDWNEIAILRRLSSLDIECPLTIQNRICMVIAYRYAFAGVYRSLTRLTKQKEVIAVLNASYAELGTGITCTRQRKLATQARIRKVNRKEADWKKILEMRKVEISIIEASIFVSKKIWRKGEWIGITNGAQNYEK